MRSRRDVLNALLAADELLTSLRAELTPFPRDSAEELVLLSRAHVVSVLTRFLGGQLRAEDVAAWAELVRRRDDVGLDPEHLDGLKEAMFRLANPFLWGELDVRAARELIHKLGR